MKRYSIMVREHGAEYELCQCDSDPVAAADGARSHTRSIMAGGRRKTVARYGSVRIRNNLTESAP